MKAGDNIQLIYFYNFFDYYENNRIDGSAMMGLLSVILSRRSDIIALAECYGVTNIQLFGSVAKGTDGPDSDIDLLIDPVLPIQDGFGFLKFQTAISELFHRKVDVVFTSGLFPPFRDSILKDAVKL